MLPFNIPLASKQLLPEAVRLLEDCKQLSDMCSLHIHFFNKYISIAAAVFGSCLG